jgi:hypothetical protein
LPEYINPENFIEIMKRKSYSKFLRADPLKLAEKFYHEHPITDLTYPPNIGSLGRSWVEIEFGKKSVKQRRDASQNNMGLSWKLTLKYFYIC